jgi:para-nitrobenzyl esterase
MKYTRLANRPNVPLLVGWNSQEGSYKTIFGNENTYGRKFKKVVEERYKDKAGEVLKVYSVSSDGEAEQVATDLAGDMFIGYSTWNWSDQQHKSGSKSRVPLLLCKPRPQMRPEMVMRRQTLQVEL